VLNKTSKEYEKKAMLTYNQYMEIQELLDSLAEMKQHIQINYYYDDAGLSLHKRNETLRVRHIGEKLTLEHKFNKHYQDHMHICDENSTAVTEMTGSLLLTGNRYDYLDSLVTVRSVYAFDGFEIMLDVNYYFGITDYEIEVETQWDVKIPETVKKIFDGSHSTPGKYKRFIQKYVQLVK